MRVTILGSGGCIPIPKPLCQCKICKEARLKGRPFSRNGPALFIHDIKALIDTPPQIADMINYVNLKKINYLLYTHLDCDHFDGNSVLTSLCFDGLKYAYTPSRSITLLSPEKIHEKLSSIKTQYGSLLYFWLKSKMVEETIINKNIVVNGIKIIPIFVIGNPATSYIYLFIDQKGKKLLYAPCDTRPFPLESEHVNDVDVFITQPGYFESGLKDGFVYPSNDPTRDDLYSIEETIEIAERIEAKKVIFTHLEEYWNRSYSDYVELEKKFNNVKFAYDGMEVVI